MQVVILCGGKGTRIRGVDDSVPKPMIPIGEKPILIHIMEFYASYGHLEFVLCLGYLGSVIRTYFGSFDETVGNATVQFTLPSGADVRVRLIDTGQETMTGARIRMIQTLVKEDDFLLTYGDGLSDVDLDKLLSFHNSHAGAMTLTAVHPPSRFGEVEIDDNGLTTSFNEKPQVSVGLISGGYFVCRQKIFDFLSTEQSLVFEAEPMRQMVREKQLFAYSHQGFWQCMDTSRDWEYLNQLEQRGESPWRL